MFYNRFAVARPGLIVLLTALCLPGCNQGDEQAAAPTAVPPPSTSAVQSIVLRGPRRPAFWRVLSTLSPPASWAAPPALCSVSRDSPPGRFDSNTGSLTGVPAATDEGTTGRITISASNAIGPTLSWTAPTENTDGTPVANLAGYHVHYGTSPDELTKTITIAGATTTTRIISGLTEGTYYFALVAYTEAGTNCGESNLASQTI